MPWEDDVLDLDGNSYQVRHADNYTLPTKVEIIKSRHGYWTKVRYNEKATDVFFSFSEKRAYKRADKKVKRFQQEKEWRENPLVLIPDPDSGRLLPIGLIDASRMLENKKKEL